MFETRSILTFHVPEVLPVIADGQTPAYNVFPFFAMNRDLDNVLADPNTNFSNNIQSAAEGTLTNVVYSGDSDKLVYDLLSAGLQIEATKAWKREQKQSAPKTPQKTAAEPELDSEQHPSHLGEPHACHNEEYTEKKDMGICLSDKSANTVKEIGKLLSHIINTELTLNVPTAKLQTPSMTVPPAAFIPKGASIAFRLPS